MILRNYISIICLLLITVFLSWKLYFYDYQQNNTIGIQNFPKIVDHWTSEDLPIDKVDKSSLAPSSSALFRRYVNSEGKYVYLYLVYSRTTPKTTNPPEICYIDTGVSILDKGKKLIKILSLDSVMKVNWLLLEHNQNRQIVYYWFKVGDIYTSSYWKQQALVAYNNLVAKPKGGALIRISVDIKQSQQDAIKLIDEFVNLIMPRLSKYSFLNNL